MNAFTAPKYEPTIPVVLQAMAGAHHALDNHGLDLQIDNMVPRRAPQVNCCGFSIKMHNNEARRNGESCERLGTVVV